MTEISNQQRDGLVRKEIRSLLDGNPPGRIDLTMCGGWADTIEALHKAHASGGTAQVRKTFDALAKADDSLTRLIASDPGPAVEEPTDTTIGKSIALGSYNLTDLGNAERLVALHGRDLRYCNTWGSWLVWDGRRWKTDDTREVERRAIDVVRRLYGEAEQLTDPKQRRELGTFALKCEADNRRRAMINSTRALLPISPEELDRNPWLLTVENGTVDLKTGTLSEHRREHFITKLAPVSFDPHAQAPHWIAFLNEVFAGRQNLIDFVQRAIGYSLTGDTREQALFILHGSGSNGKTTLLETMKAFLGDYAMKTPTETLLVKRGMGGIPADVARLRGARFVTAVEAEEGQQLAESLVKQMTGGDTLTARMLYSDFFEFIPTFKLWFGTNHKPAIRGTDHAMWRRIRLIPFSVTFAEDKQDKTLPDKLKAELSGILAWAVQGCLDWQRNGLGMPDEVKVATEKYKAEQDTLLRWMEDRCILGPTKQARAGELYKSYRNWAERYGERAESGASFSDRLLERGMEKHRGKKGNYYIGIGLVDEDPERKP